MKKQIFFVAATVALVSLASCSSNDDATEQTNKDKKIQMTIGVGAASSTDAESRAYVDAITATTSNIFWSDGSNNREIDKIKVYSAGSTATSGDIFTFAGYTNDESKQNAYFSGETTHSDAGYYIIYPQSAGENFYPSVTNNNATLTNVIKVTVPATQTPTLGSFDPKAMVQIGNLPTATAEAQSTPMKLHNACAFLYINLCENCTKVEVTSDGTYGMTGTVYVGIDSNGTIIDGTNGWVSRDPIVTLKNSDNSVIPAGQYIICVIPSGSYPKLSVTVYNNNNQHKTKSINKAVGLEVGGLYSLGKITNDSWENN